MGGDNGLGCGSGSGEGAEVSGFSLGGRKGQGIRRGRGQCLLLLQTLGGHHAGRSSETILLGVLQVHVTLSALVSGLQTIQGLRPTSGDTLR